MPSVNNSAIARNKEFQFLDPGHLEDGSLKLVLDQTCPAVPQRDRVSEYKFRMCLNHSDDKIGYVNFRAQVTPDLIMYCGSVGYGVEPSFQGQHFAERACRLLIPFIRLHGFTELWITCNPTNWASRRTCERMGAELVEIVDLPETHEMYQRGERQKCRFKLSL